MTDAYERAVELIVEQVHRKKGKLVTTIGGMDDPSSSGTPVWIWIALGVVVAAAIVVFPNIMNL